MIEKHGYLISLSRSAAPLAKDPLLLLLLLLLLLQVTQVDPACAVPFPPSSGGI